MKVDRQRAKWQDERPFAPSLDIAAREAAYDEAAHSERWPGYDPESAYSVHGLGRIWLQRVEWSGAR